MTKFDTSMGGGMWRVVFYERRGSHVFVDKSGPWLPGKSKAKLWADWFAQQGYHVALQDQSGSLEKLHQGLPG